MTGREPFEHELPGAAGEGSGSGAGRHVRRAGTDRLSMGFEKWTEMGLENLTLSGLEAEFSEGL